MNMNHNSYVNNNINNGSNFGVGEVSNERDRFKKNSYVCAEMRWIVVNATLFCCCE